jgi:hypothetical protein
MVLKDLAKYTNKWVALSVDRKKILASANGIKELDKKVKSKNLKEVIYSFILPQDKYYSP